MKESAVDLRDLLSQLMEELKISESRFFLAVERSAQPLVVIDETGNIKLANKAAALLLGRRGRALLQKQFIIPMVAGQSGRLEITRLREKKTLGFEVLQPSPQAGGLFLAALEDLTGRSPEPASGDYERFFVNTEFSFDWEYWIDTRLKVLKTTSACERLTGYPAQKFSQDIDFFISIIHPEDRQKFTSHLKQELHTPQTIGVDLRLITANGEERWIRHRCQPVYNEQGELIGRRASNREITSYKRGEEALQRSEEICQRVVEGTLDGVALTDEKGTIIEWNNGQELITGVPAHKALGRYIWDLQYQLHPPETRTPGAYEETKRFIQDVLREGQSSILNRYLQQEISLADGSRKIIQSRVFVVRTPKGFSLGGISRDISDLVRSAENMRQRLEMEELIAFISTRFINVAEDRIREEIQLTLKTAARFFGANHAFLNLIPISGGFFEDDFEWHSDDLSPPARKVKKLPLQRLEWLKGNLESYKVIHVSRLQDLPPEAAAEKKYWRSLGFGSLAIVPLVMENYLTGYLLLASEEKSKTWREADLRLLRVIANIFAGALARRRASEARRQSEERFRTISELTSDFAIVYRVEPDHSLVYEWSSSALTRITGFETKEIPHRNGWIKLVHPEDRFTVLQWINGLLRLPQVDTIEARMVTKDGRVRWIQSRCRSVWDACEERVKWLFATVSDISESKQAALVLERRAHELAMLYETSLELTTQRDLPSLLYLIVERAVRLVGTAMGGLYLVEPDGKSLRLVVSYNQPKDFTGVIIRFGEGLSGRIAKSGQALIVEDYDNWKGRAAVFGKTGYGRALGVPLKVGEKIIGVIHLTDTAERKGPFADDELRLLSLFAAQAAVAVENANLYAAIENELNERRRTEQALRESEERLRLLAEGTQDIIVLQDLQGRYCYSNGALFYGLKPDDLIGKTPYDLHDPDSAARSMEQFWQVVKSGEPMSFEIFMHGEAKGKGRWYSVHKYPVRDSQGRLVAVGTISRDISDRKQAEEEMHWRDAVLAAVSQAAEMFLTLSSMQESIRQVLQILGNASGAEHVYLFENSRDENDQPAASIYAVWDSQDAASLSNEWLGRSLPLNSVVIAPWAEILSRGQTIQSLAKDLDEERRLVIQARGVKSLIDVPIFVEGRWWGTLGIDVCEEKVWSPAEVDSLKIAANVIGAAIERQRAEDTIKRLYAAEREQREMAEALHVIGMAMNSTLDFEAVLDLLLEQVERVVPYDSACIFMVEGERTRIARLRGYERFGNDVAQEIAEILWEVKSFSNLRRMNESGNPLIINNTKTDPNWLPTHASQHIRSWIGAPVFINGKVAAFFSLDKTTPNFYQPQHAERLATFAWQAALALENARLFTETAEFLGREQRLNEISQTISRTLDIQTILKDIVRLACELLNADGGILGLMDAEGLWLRPTYGYNLPEYLMNGNVPRDGGLSWEIFESGQSLMLDEYRLHPKARSTWIDAGIHACLGVPVASGETRLGVLSLFNFDPGKRFSQRDQKLAETIGRQAGIALQNARLFEAAQKQTKEAETLRRASAVVAATLDQKEAIENVLKELAEVVPYECASVQLLRNGSLEVIGGSGWPQPEAMVGMLIPLLDVPALAEIVKEGKPKILNNASTFAGSPADAAMQSWLGTPLIFHERVLGVLVLVHRLPNFFTPDHIRMVSAFADQTAIAIENARLFAETHRLAITDPLTGLYNRRHFFHLAYQEFERSRRYERPLTVIMMDIDKFKSINDTYGHLVGDQVLQTIARRIRRCLRSVDVAARFGGDEFVALLPETLLAAGRDAARRLHTAMVRTPIEINGGSVSVLASLGAAALDDDCVTFEDLLDRADKAHYAAKRSGKNRVEVWRPEKSLKT